MTTSAAPAPARKPFTAVTWDDETRSRYGVVTGDQLGWEAGCDLGYALADRTQFTVAQARLLVDNTSTGSPMVMTWETPLRMGGRTVIETKTATVVPSQLFPPQGSSNPGSIYVSYPGFAHPVSLDRIVEVTSPETTCTYRDA